MDESLPEEVLLDGNAEAKAYEFYTVGSIEVGAACPASVLSTKHWQVW